MFSEYFNEWEVRPEFLKEFISLWPGWLGKDNYHKLDEVTENDWARFNELIRSISRQYRLETADIDEKTLSAVEDIEKTLSTYDEAMNKEYLQFSRYVIPELDCILSEEWDYTYILWHKGNGAAETLKPLIDESRLYSFRD